MTPIPYAHTLIVGDILQKNKPIEFLRLMPFQDWRAALRVFQHKQAKVKEMEQLLHTTKQTKESIKLKPSRPPQDTQLQSEIAKMNKAIEPEKTIYREATSERDTDLIENWNRISLKLTIATNLRPIESQSTRIDPNNAEEFTEDEVSGNVSLDVACRCM